MSRVFFKIFFVLTAAMAVAATVAAPGAFAEDSYAEQLDELKQRLEEVAELAAQDAELSRRLDQIKADLASFEKELETPVAGQGSDASTAMSTAAPSKETELATASPSAELPAGTQGVPNPLQRESEFLTGRDLLDDSFPGSLPIPGTGARFKIGGFAKFDFIQDFDYVGDRYEFELATIAVEGTPEYELGGRTTMHAKETRVNFDLRTVARNDDYGWEFPLQMFVELDFFDDRDSFRLQPRLRHAYGVLGRFLAGRTWSVTTDLSALAGTIDFSGGDSLYGGRVSQFRFTDQIGESLKWAVAVEEPSISISNPCGLEGSDRASVPNIAGFLRWEPSDRGHVQLGADVFRLEWQGGSTGPDDTELGFAGSLSGHYLLGGSGRDSFYGAATFGSGAAHRVIALGFDGGNDAVITPEGLDAITHWQIYGGYSHYWTESLNSTISTAWAELDNSEFQPDSAIRRAGSVHVNLIWFPYKNVSTGVDSMWGGREHKDGAKGTASRVQCMTKFSFH